MSGTVVVIGSGPCGAIAAAELVRLGADVTILDAGRAAPRGALVRVRGSTVLRWVASPMLGDRHRATGDPATLWQSSLALGGLSNYWTAAVPRFHPTDFHEGAAIDERFRWPITYDDLVPFYEVAERLLTVTAGPPIDGVPGNLVRFPARIPERWWDLALDARRHGYAMGALPMATGRPTMAARRPTGWNSWHCVLRPLLGSPRLRVVSGARALRIVWDAARGLASGVEYLDEASHERRFLECRAVVVAAGALDSTRLMLQSRSDDFPDGLGNAHGVLGRYLHDHPRQWWPVRFERGLPLLGHPMYVPRAPHGHDAPLMACSHTIGLPSAAHRVGAWVGASSDRAGVQVFGTMVPQEDHTVSLVRSEDLVREAEGPLELRVYYDGQARQNMEAARERFVEVLGAVGVRAVPQPPFHELMPGSSVHFAGTVRMHAEPTHGVLDAWNRVHGVPNVAVVDMSCFTTNPEKNPTLTAMAIAARAVHRLAADLQSGAAY